MQKVASRIRVAKKLLLDRSRIQSEGNKHEFERNNNFPVFKNDRVLISGRRGEIPTRDRFKTVEFLRATNGTLISDNRNYDLGIIPCNWYFSLLVESREGEREGGSEISWRTIMFSLQSRISEKVAKHEKHHLDQLR